MLVFLQQARTEGGNDHISKMNLTMITEMYTAIEYVGFIAISWQIINFLEWCSHLLAHVRINMPFLKEIHRIHMQHHKIDYPITNLLQDGPYKDGGGNWAFGPIVVLFTLVAWLILPQHFALMITLQMLGMIGINSYMHTEFHIRGSWMEKYDWFLKRRYLHFYHQGHMQNNMSIAGIDPTYDILFGTYVDVKIPAKMHNKCVPEKKE